MNEAVLAPGGRILVLATAPDPKDIVTWTVKEAAGGTVDEGLYTAPLEPGTYHVLATTPHGKAELRLLVRVPGVFTRVPPSPGPQHFHPAGLLTGDVLLMGSADGTRPFEILKLFDGARFTVHGPQVARDAFSCTPLPDGRLVFIGGRETFGANGQNPALAEPDRPPATAQEALARGVALGRVVEAFDPRHLQWQTLGLTRAVHLDHGAVLLGDGRILITGGSVAPGPEDDSDTSPAECFDPETGASGWTSRLVFRRDPCTSVLLKDGRALVLGGVAFPRSGDWLTSEFYDPVLDRFTPTRQHTSHFFRPSAAVAANGQVAVAAMEGYQCLPPEVLDPATGEWRLLPDLPGVRGVVALLDGTLLFWTSHACIYYDLRNQRARTVSTPFELSEPPVVLPSGRVLLTDTLSYAVTP